MAEPTGAYVVRPVMADPDARWVGSDRGVGWDVSGDVRVSFALPDPEYPDDLCICVNVFNQPGAMRLVKVEQIRAFATELVALCDLYDEDEQRTAASAEGGESRG